MTWTPDRVEECKGLWLTNRSGTEIALILSARHDFPFTKNSVICKMARLGLSGEGGTRAYTGYVEAAGILAHARTPIDGPLVEIVSPHVEYVRDFSRRHGGVEAAGADALRILKDAGAREGAPPPPFHRWPRLTRPLA